MSSSSSSAPPVVLTSSNDLVFEAADEKHYYYSQNQLLVDPQVKQQLEQRLGHRFSRYVTVKKPSRFVPPFPLRMFAALHAHTSQAQLKFQHDVIEEATVGSHSRRGGGGGEDGAAAGAGGGIGSGASTGGGDVGHNSSSCMNAVVAGAAGDSSCSASAAAAAGAGGGASGSAGGSAAGGGGGVSSASAAGTTSTGHLTGAALLVSGGADSSSDDSEDDVEMRAQIDADEMLEQKLTEVHERIYGTAANPTPFSQMSGAAGGVGSGGGGGPVPMSPSMWLASISPTHHSNTNSNSDNNNNKKPTANANDVLFGNASPLSGARHHHGKNTDDDAAARGGGTRSRHQMSCLEAAVTAPRHAPALSHSSLFVFPPHTTLRIVCYNLVRTKIFEYIILFFIIANCVFLAIEDQAVFGDNSEQVYQAGENVFVAVFSLEMVLKIVAFGFVGHRGSYLRDPWNGLDFLIMVLTYLNYIQSSGNFTALRSLRVLRPLRSLNAIPGLKILVRSFLASLRAMGPVALLSLMVMFVFAIVGVQLFMGTFRYSCVNTVSGKNTWLPCRNGTTGDIDSSYWGFACSANETCRDVGNPGHGFYSFDNILQAILLIFSFATFDGWTVALERGMGDVGVISFFYFGLAALVVGILLPNLVLAVINLEYSKEQKRDLYQRTAHANRVRQLISLKLNALHLRMRRQYDEDRNSRTSYSNPLLFGGNRAWDENVNNNKSGGAGKKSSNDSRGGGGVGSLTLASNVSDVTSTRSQQLSVSNKQFANSLNNVITTSADHKVVILDRPESSSSGTSNTPPPPLNNNNNNKSRSGADSLASSQQHAEQHPSLRLQEGDHDEAPLRMEEVDDSTHDHTQIWNAGNAENSTNAVSFLKGAALTSTPPPPPALNPIALRLNPADASSSASSLALPTNVLPQHVSSRGEGQEDTATPTTTDAERTPTTTPTSNTTPSKKKRSSRRNQQQQSPKSSPRRTYIENNMSNMHFLLSSPQKQLANMHDLNGNSFNNGSNYNNNNNNSNNGNNNGKCGNCCCSCCSCASSSSSSCSCCWKWFKDTFKLSAETWYKIDLWRDACHELTEGFPRTSAQAAAIHVSKSQSSLADVFSDESNTDASTELGLPKAMRNSQDDSDDGAKQQDLDDDIQNDVQSGDSSAKVDSGQVRSTWFTTFIVVMILLNTLLLASQHHGQADWLSETQTVGNRIFTAIFAVEMIMRLFSIGWRAYVYSPFDLLDGFIVVSSFAELIFSGGGDGASSFSVFRALRLLRVMKLLKQFPSLRSVVRVALYAMGDAGYLLFIVFLYIFIFSLLGHALFAGVLSQPADPNSLDAHTSFDSFTLSFYASFQLVSMDLWVWVMYDAMRKTNPVAALFFVVQIITGGFILVSLFLSILVAAFRKLESRVDVEEPADSILERQNAFKHNMLDATIVQRVYRFGAQNRGTEFNKNAYKTSTLGFAGFLKHNNTTEHNIINNLSAPMAKEYKRAKMHREEEKRKLAVELKRRDSTTNVAFGVGVSRVFSDSGDDLLPAEIHSTGNNSNNSNDDDVLRHPYEDVDVIDLEQLHIREEDYGAFEQRRNSTFYGGTARRNSSAHVMPTASAAGRFSRPSLQSMRALAGNSNVGGGELMYGPRASFSVENIAQHQATIDEIDEIERMEAGGKVDEHEFERIVAWNRAATEFATRAIPNMPFVEQLSEDAHAARYLLRHQFTDYDRLRRATSVSRFFQAAPLRSAIEQAARRIPIILSDQGPAVDDPAPKTRLPVCSQCGEELHYALPAAPLVAEPSPEVLHSLKCGRIRMRRAREKILKELVEIIDFYVQSGEPAVYQKMDTLLAQAWEVETMGKVRAEHFVEVEEPWASLKAEVEEEIAVLDLRVGEDELGKSLMAQAFSVIPTEHQTNGGESLYLFKADNPFRRLCSEIVSTQAFELFILFCVVVSSALMAISNPLDDPHSTKELISFYGSFVFTIIFAVEAAMKIIAMGFYSIPGAYIKDPWNVLDFVIVLVSLVSDTQTEVNLSFLKVFRTLRATRALRVLRRAKGMKTVVFALVQNLKAIANVALLCFVFLLIFAILGVQLFSGEFYHCSDPSMVNRTMCVGNWFDPNAEPFLKNYTQTGYVVPRVWQPDFVNFDNVARALLSLFQITSAEGWMYVVWRATDTCDPDAARSFNCNPAGGLFFIAFFAFSAFFLMQLFVSFIIYNYEKVNKTVSGSEFMTAEQRVWISTQQLVSNFRPSVVVGPLKGIRMSQLIYKHVLSQWLFDVVIALFILMDVIVLSLDHYSMSAEFEAALIVAGTIVAFAFLAEAVIKLLCYGLRYFRASENRFDFFLVIVGILSWNEVGINLRFLVVLRVIRLSRILRLLRFAKGIQILLETILFSLPSIANMGAFVLLITFSFAVLGVDLFAKIYIPPNALVLNRRMTNFRSLDATLMLLFRFLTLEDWVGAMIDASVEVPTTRGGDSSGGVMAPLYFCLYVILTSYIVLNLIMASMLVQFELTMSLDDSNPKMAILHRFVERWSEYDPDATMLMPTKYIPQMLVKLGPPMGLLRAGSRVQVLQKMGSFFIPEHKGEVHFMEVLLALEMGLSPPKKDEADRIKREFFVMMKDNFPELDELDVQRIGNGRMITADLHFAQTYLRAAEKRRRAYRDMQRVLREKYGSCNDDDDDDASSKKGLGGRKKSLLLDPNVEHLLSSLPTAASVGDDAHPDHGHEIIMHDDNDGDVEMATTERQKRDSNTQEEANRPLPPSARSSDADRPASCSTHTRPPSRVKSSTPASFFFPVEGINSRVGSRLGSRLGSARPAVDVVLSGSIAATETTTAAAAATAAAATTTKMTTATSSSSGPKHSQLQRRRSSVTFEAVAFPQDNDDEDDDMPRSPVGFLRHDGGDDGGDADVEADTTDDRQTNTTTKKQSVDKKADDTKSSTKRSVVGRQHGSSTSDQKPPPPPRQQQRLITANKSDNSSKTKQHQTAAAATTTSDDDSSDDADAMAEQMLRRVASGGSVMLPTRSENSPTIITEIKSPSSSSQTTAAGGSSHNTNTKIKLKSTALALRGAQTILKSKTGDSVVLRPSTRSMSVTMMDEALSTAVASALDSSRLERDHNNNNNNNNNVTVDDDDDDHVAAAKTGDANGTSSSAFVPSSPSSRVGSAALFVRPSLRGLSTSALTSPVASPRVVASSQKSFRRNKNGDVDEEKDERNTDVVLSPAEHDNSCAALVDVPDKPETPRSALGGVGDDNMTSSMNSPRSVSVITMKARRQQQ